MNARAATAFVDVLFLVALILILMPHGEDKADPPLLGVMVAELTWRGDHDVDLWVRGPGTSSVGYSARQAGPVGLVFDDLGTNTGNILHREVVVIHPAPDGDAKPGHYVINAHLFRGRGDLVAEVDVTLWVREGDRLEMYWTGHLRLTGRDEATAIRFDVRNGEIIPGSERSDFVSIKGVRTS